jgi:ADP-heptose:LPS heptosyltransferase
MLERPRTSLGMVGARFHFRRSREGILSFVDTLSSASSILLIMPLDGSPLYPVAPVLTMLRRRKSDEQITVVVASHSTEAFGALDRSPFIRILPGEINLFFLPRRDVLSRIQCKQYDLAIDLNLDFHLPSGYICRESKARIRVGFSGRHSDLFYNFQVQTSYAESRTLRYERFAHCLEMF